MQQRFRKPIDLLCCTWVLLLKMTGYLLSKMDNFSVMTHSKNSYELLTICMTLGNEFQLVIFILCWYSYKYSYINFELSFLKCASFRSFILQIRPCPYRVEQDSINNLERITETEDSVDHAQLIHGLWTIWVLWTMNSNIQTGEFVHEMSSDSFKFWGSGEGSEAIPRIASLRGGLKWVLLFAAGSRRCRELWRAWSLWTEA